MTSISDTQPAELKDIPKVKEWPLIGSLIGMATDPARFFYNNYRKYGPCYRMTLLGKRYTVLAGPEAVARHGGIPPYRETQGHVRKVMAVYAQSIGDQT